MNLNQAKPALLRTLAKERGFALLQGKQAQLEQVERCRRVKIHWLSDAGRFTLFEREQYKI